MIGYYRCCNCGDMHSKEQGNSFSTPEACKKCGGGRWDVRVGGQKPDWFKPKQESK